MKNTNKKKTVELGMPWMIALYPRDFQENIKLFHEGSGSVDIMDILSKGLVFAYITNESREHVEAMLDEMRKMMEEFITRTFTTGKLIVWDQSDIEKQFKPIINTMLEERKWLDLYWAMWRNRLVIVDSLRWEGPVSYDFPLEFLHGDKVNVAFFATHYELVENRDKLRECVRNRMGMG